MPSFSDNCFDAIYMTDVLEHISNPLPLLKLYAKALKPGGVIFVTTPNIYSTLACVLKKRWWHYRLAHVGYYNKKTLKRVMSEAGLSLQCHQPVKWCFTYGYIHERLSQYLPFLHKINCPKLLKDRIFSISLRDSILAVYMKSK
jgi:2-polyprenyl-3-methyl-5-hydroxy-6-metoxy-1,4-benzoquinol methylase